MMYIVVNRETKVVSTLRFATVQARRYPLRRKGVKDVTVQHGNHKEGREGKGRAGIDVKTSGIKTMITAVCVCMKRGRHREG